MSTQFRFAFSAACPPFESGNLSPSRSLLIQCLFSLFSLPHFRFVKEMSDRRITRSAARSLANQLSSNPSSSASSSMNTSSTGQYSHLAPISEPHSTPFFPGEMTSPRNRNASEPSMPPVGSLRSQRSSSEGSISAPPVVGRDVHLPNASPDSSSNPRGRQIYEPPSFSSQHDRQRSSSFTGVQSLFNGGDNTSDHGHGEAELNFQSTAPPQLYYPNTMVNLGMLSEVLKPMMDSINFITQQLSSQSPQENQEPPSERSQKHVRDPMDSNSPARGENQGSKHKQRRLRSPSIASLGSRSAGHDSYEPATSPPQPAYLKQDDQKSIPTSLASSTVLVPFGIVQACQPEERAVYNRHYSVTGREDEWDADAFAKWYLREGVTNTVQSWARNFRDLRDLQRKIEKQQQQAEPDSLSDCEEVGSSLLEDGPQWIAPRTVDPSQGSGNIRALWPEISQKEGDRLMTLIPKFNLGSSDPELRDFCAYYARYRYTLACQGPRIANYILVQSVDMDAVRVLHTSLGKRLPALENRILARYMGQAIYRKMRIDLLECTRCLREGYYGCHTLKDLNQRVVDLLFCRYDRCSSLQLCTSMVYCLSYHMPTEDRQPFYNKVEAIYPTVMEAAMGNETEEYPIRRRYERGQCRVPATSEEADAFADFVVKVASRRFSRITEAARHREVLIGTTQNPQRGRQSSVSSTSTKPQQGQRLPSVQKKDELRSQLRCTFCERVGHLEETCYKKHPELRPLKRDMEKSWTKGDGRKPQWPGDQRQPQDPRRGRGHHPQRKDGFRRPKPTRENEASQLKSSVPVPPTTTPSQLAKPQTCTTTISSQLARPQSSTQLKNERDFHSSETL